MARIMRFGIIGCGAVAAVHAQAIRTVEGAELVAVAGRSRDRVAAFAAGNAIQGYENYRQMLARSDIDAVSICTPSGLHGEIALHAAAAGKHALVEKPMEISLSRADAMIAAFRSRGLTLSVISQHRFDPDAVRLKEAIDTGSMGRPVMAAASVHWYRGQSYYDSAGWRGTWQLDGGGVLINQAIHTLDLLQFFMGPVKHVTAHKATLSHERIEVEDTAAAAIRFESGALGSFSCTTSAYPGYSNRLELFWTGGSAVMESDRLTHFYRRGDHNGNEPFNEAYGQAGHQADGASDPMGIRSDAHAMQLRDFIASIWDKRRPAVDGEEGRKALAFILASYKSSETGSTVCIQNQGE